MKIAFVSLLNSRNIHAWSGTPYYMVSALKDKGHEVTEIGPLYAPCSKLLNLGNKILTKLTGKYYDYNRSPFVAKSFAKQVQRCLKNESFDLILCPSSIPCAYLETTIPIISWEDATFAGMVGYYLGGWQKLSNLALKQGNALQQKALTNSTLSLFSSDWAANSALQNYKVDARKVKVIAFGANITETPTQSRVEEAIKNRSKTTCHLLFIGVDWYRKGGDLVIQTANILQEKGIKVIVDVVGCEPSSELPDFVRRHGFVSKSNASGKEFIQELLFNAHFLFVPSLAECYGLVFAEASAYGVPSLTRATGGIPTAVKNGVNGYAFPFDVKPQTYADYIAQEFSNVDNYIALALSARQEFEKRLNWDSAINCFEALVSEIR